MNQKTTWVALASIFIAIMALAYTAWRNETTEVNRSVRTASFEILRELGELQTVVHFAHYGKNRAEGDPITGWQHVILIKDLALLVPPPIPEESQHLMETWRENWEDMTDHEENSDTIIAGIDSMRSAVLSKLKKLR